MPSTCCPTCGRAIRATATRKPAVTLPERAELDARYQAHEIDKAAYYKACESIARRDDLRFFLRVAGPIPPEIRAEAASLLADLETRPAKPADAKRIYQLKFAYRCAKERARRVSTVAA